MKNTKFTKLAVLLVAAVLLIGSAIGITVSADESEDQTTELSIFEANVVYNDKMYIAVTVNGEAPENAIKGIVVWNGVKEFTLENADYTDFTANRDGERLYYTTPGVAAANIDTVFYFSAAYTLDGEITLCGDVESYSIAEYAGTRLVKDTITAEQAKVYANLLNYGLASENIITDENSNPTSNYAIVKAVNGTVGRHDVNVGGWAGYEVMLRADAKNPAGEYFIGWYDADNTLVSAKRICTVKSPASGVAVYTAKYGNKADSLYQNTIDIEAFANGLTTSLTGFANVSAGSKEGYGTNNFYVVESLNGDKSIYLERLYTQSGTYLKPNSTVTGAHAAEMDITYTTFNTASANHAIRLTIKNGDDAALTLRFGYVKSGDNISLYAYNAASANDRTVYPKLDDGTHGYGHITAGETVTWGVALETTEIEPTVVDDGDGAATETKNYQTLIKFYVNGEYIGAISLADTPGFNYHENANTSAGIAQGDPTGFVVESDCVLNNIEFYGLFPSIDCLYFDNITYFATNPFEN